MAAELVRWKPEMGRLIPVSYGLWGAWVMGSVEFLLLARWWRPLVGEGNSQVVDDLIDTTTTAPRDSSER